MLNTFFKPKLEASIHTLHPAPIPAPNPNLLHPKPNPGQVRKSQRVTSSGGKWKA